jgi:polar amino acid transport system permease protein
MTSATHPEKPKNDSDEVDSHRLGTFASLYRAPWWLIVLMGAWILVIISIITDKQYGDIYNQLQRGLSLTVFLAVFSYFLSLIIGLLVGLVRAYRPKSPDMGMNANKVAGHIGFTTLYNLLSVYVEFMRGIPPIVFLLIVGFIIVPAISDPIVAVLNQTLVPVLREVANVWNNTLGKIQVEVIGLDLRLDYVPLFGIGLESDLVWRGRDPATAILGLALVYGAFLSEVFRSGIQSIHKGQMEAAKSLGMSFPQAMRFIIIPQAVRRVLPELGNNFISMIKDTSLVTVLGTAEITQLARQWSGSTFLFLQTYAVLSLMYLTMTVLGSIMVQVLERNLRQHER